MDILFFTSEAIPFAKTGGLGDVAGLLPRALSASEKVTLIMPGYDTEIIKKSETTRMGSLSLPIGEKTFSATVKKVVPSANFCVYFICNDYFFGRGSLYGDSSGDYPDNFDRFLFFQWAALEFIKKHHLRFDIIHCNDWQTALIPVLLKLKYRSGPFENTKIVFSIHNLGYQGIFPGGHFDKIGLPSRFFSPDYLEFYGNLNCMKGGIIFSDWIVTVSPTYAREIVTRENGFGLDGLLRKFSFKLSGILNGVDYNQWDPRIDPLISSRYSVQSLEKKIVNKQMLFSDLGIQKSTSDPLLVVISRISEQKGMDILLRLLPGLLQEPLYFILLGVGDASWTEKIKETEKRFPGKMTFLNYFDEKMAHQLEAAGDILFMPSMYEPCGLNQIFSLKYGTVPIVRATGGLDDSIQEFDPLTGLGNGFKFHGNDLEEIMAVMKKALRLFQEKTLWRQIQENGMMEDFSWQKVVPTYLALYNKILTEVPQNG